MHSVATVWAPQFPETEQEAPPMLGGDKEVSAASGSFLQVGSLLPVRATWRRKLLQSLHSLKAAATCMIPQIGQ